LSDSEAVPPADPDKPCPHLHFQAFVEVNRILADGADPDSEPIGFAAEVGVKCAQCDEPFTWVGTPAGLSPGHPTSSIDKLILNAPLRPASSDPDFGMGMPGYAVTAYVADDGPAETLPA
jgi:hypothetical protein